MSKLYVFGIGGTGSRVLKSLVMMLASGVECGVDTIVPIIIDRDAANKDLSRTQILIENYIQASKMAETGGENRFFKTKIELLNNQLCLPLRDQVAKFESFIGRDGGAMSEENKALVDMLFSEETLDLDMTEGFQGNPNIGSVVLNQFDSSDIFQAFGTDFKSSDNKIFIISSIFGGTGASGFPLLRKILQTTNKTDKKGNVLDNWGLVNKAKIGAITVLPYFVVNAAKDDSLVNSDTFTDKTRAALSYYKTEDKNVDTLYYIADRRTTTYEHHKGGDNQKNNAHFVELAAALSVLDFVNPDKESENIHRNSEQNIDRTTYKEFGIINDAPKISFKDLSDETNKMLVNPLSRFLAFARYMGYSVEKTSESGTDKFEVRQLKKYDILRKEQKYQPYARKRFNKKFRSNGTIPNLEALQASFVEWLMEMEHQDRKFSPFNLDTSYALDFIRGNMDIVNTKGLRLKSWSNFDNELNKLIGSIDKSLEKDKQFIELFYRVTEAIINFEK